MRFTLSLAPLHNSYADILKCFYQGKPLSADQINFLHQYHAKLSDDVFDRITNYYDIFQKKTIRLENKQLTRNNLQRLKAQITDYVADSTLPLKLSLTPKQFFQFRALLTSELIFFHGNQLLTGAPYFPGGIQHVDFLQWGNLFGVVKYEALPGETSNKANILIAFEEMVDRNYEQCTKNRHLKQQQLAARIIPKSIETVSYEPISVYTPKLQR